MHGRISFPDNPLSFAYMLTRLIFFVQVVYYLVISSRLMMRHKESISNYYSNLDEKDRNWGTIMYFTYIFTVVICLVFVALGMEIYQSYPSILLIPGLLSSIAIFLIGFLGFAQYQVINANTAEEVIAPAPSERENWQSPELNLKVKDLFEVRRLHINPDLSIWDVAAELNTNRTYISNFINQYYGMNFSMFVNRFRVEEAAKMLEDTGSNKYTLETIAESCGFGSLNSFIRAFRTVQNMTPGQYRELQQKKNSEGTITQVRTIPQ